MIKRLLLTALFVLTATSVFANPYVRISGGSSDWNSPTADLHSRDDQRLFTERSNPYAIAIGTNITDALRGELEYTNFGDEDLAFNDSYTKCIFIFCHDFSDDYMTNFQAYGITGWLVYDIPLGASPVSFNVRGGLTRAQMKATVNDGSVRDSDAGVAYGAGVDFAFNDSISVNLSWEQHNMVFDGDFDYRPTVSKLGATWQF